ncbi:hypothetical protein SLS62_004349 [Diatrype stigma]|uniref:Uncharacterized protein n=1 Tax=Diatrype stigma TaxID=117547 RepID=A0AAN9YTT1_9PEZI
MPQKRKGRTLPLSKLIKWGGLSLQDGLVTDSPEIAQDLSRSLTYGLISQTQAREEKTLVVPIIDQVDTRLYEFVYIMLEKRDVVAREGWEEFWEQVLVALPWVDVGAGTPGLRSDEIEELGIALAKARARANRNVSYVNRATHWPSYLGLLDQWLEFLEGRGEHPDAGIAAGGPSVHDKAATGLGEHDHDTSEAPTKTKRALDSDSIGEEAAATDASQYHRDKRMKAAVQEVCYGVEGVTLEERAAARREERMQDSLDAPWSSGNKMEEAAEKEKTTTTAKGKGKEVAATAAADEKTDAAEKKPGAAEEKKERDGEDGRKGKAADAVVTKMMTTMSLD